MEASTVRASTSSPAYSATILVASCRNVRHCSASPSTISVSMRYRRSRSTLSGEPPTVAARRASSDGTSASTSGGRNSQVSGCGIAALPRGRCLELGDPRQQFAEPLLDADDRELLLVVENA